MSLGKLNAGGVSTPITNPLLPGSLGAGGIPSLGGISGLDLNRFQSGDGHQLQPGAGGTPDSLFAGAKPDGQPGINLNQFNLGQPGPKLAPGQRPGQVAAPGLPTVAVPPTPFTGTGTQLGRSQMGLINRQQAARAASGRARGFAGY